MYSGALTSEALEYGSREGKPSFVIFQSIFSICIPICVRSRLELGIVFCSSTLARPSGSSLGQGTSGLLARKRDSPGGRTRVPAPSTIPPRTLRARSPPDASLGVTAKSCLRAEAIKWWSDYGKVRSLCFASTLGSGSLEGASHLRERVREAPFLSTDSETSNLSGGLRRQHNDPIIFRSDRVFGQPGSTGHPKKEFILLEL